MKFKIAVVRWLKVILSILVITSVRGANIATAPDPAALVKTGRETRTRLLDQPAQWIVRCTLSPGEAITIIMVSDGERRSRVFAHEKEKHVSRLFRIVERDDSWFVEEGGQWGKWRPFEATLHVTGAYYFNSFAELMTVVDESALRGAEFVSRKGTILSYRFELPVQQRRMVAQALAAYEQAKKEDPKSIKSDVEQQILVAKKLVAEGTPLRVDEATGLIVETQVNNMSVSVEDFRWMKEAPVGVFEVPNSGWTDHTKMWSNPDNWIMVGYDPVATKETKRPALDGFMVDVSSGALRRLAFNGAYAMPLCFLEDHQAVLISGTDPVAGIGLVKLDLGDGSNTPLSEEASSGGMPLAASLAPNGKEVALLHGLTGEGGSILDFQMRLLDLSSGKITNLGKPGRLGAPFSWLPDGSGLILKRFVPQKSLSAIEERVICRMNRDGELTDLFAGDDPIVLKKTRKILFERNDEWATCNFDGSEVVPFGDGLRRHGFPTVSADGERLAFMHFTTSGAPELTIVDISNPDARRAVAIPGFVGMPKW